MGNSDRSYDAERRDKRCAAHCLDPEHWIMVELQCDRSALRMVVKRVGTYLDRQGPPGTGYISSDDMILIGYSARLQVLHQAHQHRS
jgi:hypothetical protein